MFCGLSHAFHAISLGNFDGAITFHPLAFVAYGVVLFLLFFSLIRIVLWKNLRIPKRLEEIIVKTIFAFFTLFWLYRLVSGSLI
jgi:hypothetical protein